MLLNRLASPALWMTLAVVAAVNGGYWASRHELRPVTAIIAPPPVALANTEAPDTTAAPQQPVSNTVNLDALARGHDAQVAAASWSRASSLAWITFILLAVLALILLGRGPAIQTRDSDRFREALDVWGGLITAAPHTPRSVKRFLNRTRYKAISQLPPAERPEVSRRWSFRTGVAWLTARLGGEAQAAPESATGAGDGQEVLVSEGFVEYFHSDWLESAKNRSALADPLKLSVDPEDIESAPEGTQAFNEVLTTAAEHRRLFNSNPFPYA